VKLTDGGRTVYGGGVSLRCEISPYKPNKFQDSLLHTTRCLILPSTTPPSQNHAEFRSGRCGMLDFRKFLDSEKIAYTEAEMIESNEWLRSNIKSELFVDTFGQEEGLK